MIKALSPSSGLCYNHITIVNDDSNIVHKFEASLTDMAWVTIYDYMFIVQATDGSTRLLSIEVNLVIKALSPSSGLYYKHIMIVYDNSSIVNKFEASLTDEAWVIIYDHHMYYRPQMAVPVISTSCCLFNGIISFTKSKTH